jgi:2-oxoisovalerate dehydrogenase E1 component
MNTFFKQQFEQSDKVIFIGEDCLSPYGGAFKVAKDLSIMKPNQLYSTPISESAIMGISNGLALNGFKPFAEIMFGDFITLAFDQIINHASKFHHMFNKQIDCPVVVRTPMGGRRGYGPTHSQTLDKFLIGIDYVKTAAINTFFNPAIIFESILQEKQPVIVLENKTDYGKKILTNPSKAFVYKRSNDAYPIVHIKPIVSEADVTIVAYGGMADYVSTMIEELFKECDIKPELIIPSLISEIPIEFIAKQLSSTKKLIVKNKKYCN